MKNNIKKIIAPTLGAIIIPMVSVATIACSSKNETPREWDFSKIWSNLKSITTYDYSKFVQDVEIDHWVDGDTLVYIDKDDNTKKHTLRIEYVDTPELHEPAADGTWVDTTGLEYEYASKGFELGKKLMPKHSTIRVWLTGSHTYGREVGSVFFGTNYNKSFELELLKNGFAYPFIAGSMTYSNIRRVTDAAHYLAYPLAEAYNFAKSNGEGVFDGRYDATASAHGSTDTTLFEKGIKEGIYNSLDVDFW